MKFKKALSPIISYAILIVIVVSISVVVYSSMKTYVAPSALSCPDGVSIYINQVNCSLVDGKYQMNISLKNNGRFSIGGYFVNARDTGKKIIDPLTNLTLIEQIGSSGETSQRDMKPGVLFLGANSVANPDATTSENPFDPGKTIITYFKSDKEIISIDLIPFRWEGDKKRIVNCGSAKVVENVVCS